ncbi:transmembrane protein, putative [Medicago truncatula]|uniref:Transmembrane protein, putative n=1 Tax=Medicago truncatula TaxID=3880 RepID=G7K1C2_MEDTR|nr:transmembrane protein, putative [Medicago truncatula]
MAFIHIIRVMRTDRRNGKAIIKLTHTSGGTGVRTPIIASGLTISAFCQLNALLFLLFEIRIFAIYAKSVTIIPKDIQLAKRIAGERV